MGLDLKRLQFCTLFFFCGWAALSQGTETPGAIVQIDPKTIEKTAGKSVSESNIMEELAESATKNQGQTKSIKGIKGLKVKDIQPPIIEVSFVKDVGMRMAVTSKITIAGKSFIGGTMEITVESSMITVSKMEVLDPLNLKFEVLKCTVELISCKTNLPSSMLPKIVNKFLNSTLGKVLPTMMCPAADKVIGIMKERMLSVFEPCDCGHGVTMQYTLKENLEKEEKYIGIFFNTVILKNGETIDVPADPPASTNLPPKKDGSTVVILPVNVLNGAMEALKDVFDCQVQCAPNGNEVTAEVKVTATPTYDLGEDSATMTVPVEVKVPQEGLVMTMTIVTRATFAVESEKLKTTLELDSMHDVNQISGSSDEATQTAIVEAIISWWNDNVPHICLPSLLGGSYGNAPAKIHQDNLALYVGDE